jgi:two-component system OmpR family response regulator
MRVLVVEDEAKLAERIRAALVAAGLTADIAPDGVEAQFLGETETYDAAVLDLGLPKIDGLTVLEHWRAAGRKMPVLILTARGRWHEKLAGFNAGADDYLTKPFEMDELVVRIKALIRRSTGHASAILECGALKLDTNAARFEYDGQPIDLTAQEYRILAFLMHHAGKVVSRTELLEHVYARDADSDSNVLDVLIGRIRKKLPEPLITTVRGQGFVLGRTREAS